MAEEDNLSRPATKQDEYSLAILTELREIKVLLAGGKKADASAPSKKKSKSRRK